MKRNGKIWVRSKAPVYLSDVLSDPRVIFFRGKHLIVEPSIPFPLYDAETSLYGAFEVEADNFPGAGKIPSTLIPVPEEEAHALTERSLRHRQYAVELREQVNAW